MSLPLPKMEPCFFCEIIEGKADQWTVIARNDLTITVLNMRQFEDGQCVVLPVRHAPTLLDLDEKELTAVMADARQLAQAMINVFAPDGILLYQNNGTGSGQEVPHFHLHVVPRRPDSNWGLGPPHIARLEQEQNSNHFDHDPTNAGKRQTVQHLRKYLR